MSTYENAPATKLLATACACCGRDLVDAVSVETGIGPDCREKYGVTFDTSNAAHAEANALVFQVARKGITAREASLAFDRLHELGFTVLAERIAKRFRARVTKGPSVEELRAAYAKIRAAFCYDNCEPREFDALVKATNPTCPADYVLAAEAMSCPCRRCAGTGKFITYVENGSPRGPGGDCFRCGGKGRQDVGDVHRNRAYDQYMVNRKAS